MTNKHVTSHASVVCMGESMAQVVPANGASLLEAETFLMQQAGAESNVAVSLARLGTNAAWASFIGDDPIGARLLASIERLGVNTHLVMVQPGARTGVFFKDPAKEGSRVYYYRSGSAAASMDPEFARRVIDASPRWLHLTGVTPALSSSCREAVMAAMSCARSTGVPVSFDVNYRPALWPDAAVAGETIRAAANEADVVFVGLDEAHAIWGCETADDIRSTLGLPSTLIVKNGPLDCTAFNALGKIIVPALRVEVVEPVGAGDAFAAGWIHGHLAGLSETAALRLGHLMAGIALTALSDHGDLDGDPQSLVNRAISGIDWAESPRTEPSNINQI